MERSVAIGFIELQLDPNSIGDSCFRCLSNVAVEIEIKAPIAAWHHVDPPGFLRFAIYTDEHRHGTPPTLAQSLGPQAAHVDERVDTGDLYLRGKGHAMLTERIKLWIRLGS